MKLFMGIDPSPETSGVALWDAEARRCIEPVPKATDDEVLAMIDRLKPDLVGIEWMTATNQNFGLSTLSTVRHEMRLHYAIASVMPQPPLEVTRIKVRQHFLGRSNGGDKLVNDAIAASLGFTSQEAAKGTRRDPGPLYGVATHAWAALAVAMRMAHNYYAPPGA